MKRRKYFGVPNKRIEALRINSSKFHRFAPNPSFRLRNNWEKYHRFAYQGRFAKYIRVIPNDSLITIIHFWPKSRFLLHIWEISSEKCNCHSYYHCLINIKGRFYCFSNCNCPYHHGMRRIPLSRLIVPIVSLNIKSEKFHRLAYYNSLAQQLKENWTLSRLLGTSRLFGTPK